MRRPWPTGGCRAKNIKRNYAYVRRVIFLSCCKNPLVKHDTISRSSPLNDMAGSSENGQAYRSVHSIGGLEGRGIVRCKSSFHFTLPINLPVLCSGSKKLTAADRECCNLSDLTPTATGLIPHLQQQF
jgi:hypothetical protein